MVSRSKQLILANCTYIGGVVFCFVTGVYLPLWLLVVILVGYGALWAAHSKVRWLMLVPMFLLLGIWYVHMRSLIVTSPAVSTHIGEKVEIEGVVSSEPYWDEQGSYRFELTNPQISHKTVHGVVRVKSLSSHINEGDKVKVSGKLYRAMGRADAQLIYAQPVRIAQATNWQLTIKQRISSSLASTFPRPVNQFIEGLMIGNRSGLPTAIQNQLSALGLSHITAVSGYNLTIVVMMATYLLRKRWKWFSLVLAGWIIIGFVLVTGASASVVRAGIMTGLFLLIRHYGKSISLGTALLYTAVITLTISPSYVTDISWQLSFAALAGIIFLSDVLMRFLPSKPAWFMQLLAVSLSAQLTTLPIIAYYFGGVSLLAPLANTIIMPFVELMTVVGFVAAGIGIVIPNWSPLLFAPINLLCRAILTFINFLSRLPMSQVKVTSPSSVFILLYYCLICIIVYLQMHYRTTISYNKKKDLYERSQQMA